ncbi:hypothetical protein TorRG33x02_054930 [Trema orientale]|uniref:CLAVATA3/ESR (CLE)-related protein n=1 Tax=Trema orientale TaxID=63057 RepID=A0A2P5FLG3_TREOI|nr:hypothetical protein TorRG33x02_054930 [Trema orientale]
MASSGNAKKLSSIVVMMIIVVFLFSLLFSSLPLSEARTILGSDKDILIDHSHSPLHNLGLHNEPPTGPGPIRFRAHTTSNDNPFGSLDRQVSREPNVLPSARKHLLSSFYGNDRRTPGGPDPIHDHPGENNNNAFGSFEEINRLVPGGPDPTHNPGDSNAFVSFSEINRLVPGVPDPIHHDQGDKNLFGSLEDINT